MNIPGLMYIAQDIVTLVVPLRKALLVVEIVMSPFTPKDNMRHISDAYVFHNCLYNICSHRSTRPYIIGNYIRFHEPHACRTNWFRLRYKFQCWHSCEGTDLTTFIHLRVKSLKALTRFGNLPILYPDDTLLKTYSTSTNPLTRTFLLIVFRLP